ncbi:MAG: sugar phosphate isomerase/epimerase [Verrucomicrobia bacterium]|nr:sugar phosphate isomerase/epimerase [Verrucomicrobiota bacterium]
MKQHQLGAQLYTVRDYLHDLPAFKRSLERLKAIGYEAVELIHSDKVSDADIAKMCDEAGLAVAAAHVKGQVLIEHPQATVEKLQAVRSKIAVYPFPSGVDFSSRSQVEQLGRQLEQSAGVLKAAGLTLAYHNHAVEFSRVEGELVYEIIRRTAPALSFELDPYWVQYAGMSPERWIEELDGKLISLHLKDFGVSHKHGEQPIMSEVGAGNLGFEHLVPQSEKIGCQWFIVEQDVTPGNPFDSLERSFQFVRSRLLEPA